jgi:hypothetical protein
MNPEDLRKSLIAAVRSQRPSDRVPVAFEQRIMSQIRSESVHDPIEFWAAGLWRAVLPSVVLLGVAGFLHFQNSIAPDISGDSSSASDELELVMLDTLDSGDSW